MHVKPYVFLRKLGCALDCSFCSTGKQGFQRDLTPQKSSVNFGWQIIPIREDVPVAERERTVTNVVMMGMGEPLLNYDAVLSSMQLMLDDFAYGISKRRVTLSTSGVVPKISISWHKILMSLWQFRYMHQMMN